MSLVTGLAQAIGDEDDGVEGLTWSLADGGNVFEEASPDSPDVCVSLYATGGPEADSLLPFDAPTVQIIVRGDTDPTTASDLWDKVYSFLHGKRYTTLPDGTFLVYALAVQSSPIAMGPDTSGRYRFSMNLRTEIRLASTHRPIESES